MLLSSFNSSVLGHENGEWKNDTLKGLELKIETLLLLSSTNNFRLEDSNFIEWCIGWNFFMNDSSSIVNLVGANVHSSSKALIVDAEPVE